jgi:hypothetical protein
VLRAALVAAPQSRDAAKNSWLAWVKARKGNYLMDLRKGGLPMTGEQLQWLHAWNEGLSGGGASPPPPPPPPPANRTAASPRASHTTHTLTLLRPPFYAGHAGGFDVLRAGGETEEQIEARREKKAEAGA